MIKLPYYLTQDYIADFRQLTGNKKIPHGTIDKKTVADLLEDESNSFYTDLRLPALSIRTKENTDIKSLIYNYSILFSIIMLNDNVISLYFDYGLIPLAFYPTSHMEYIDYTDEILMKIGLHHYKIPARYNHDLKNIHQTMNDSWVSRIDAADIFGLKAESLKLKELYWKVMNYESS